ncbi:hypothetical protein [Bradyrhizobium sp. NAS80.1]|uniref:hypothetical protein n=1 Tax=Bradyrhizobium sp. NAS80.1 TaxID=1680159 RepID=UPI001FD9CFD0|nr:hypothetical protein [Bradyrhizobium sp. NAS80.1]
MTVMAESFGNSFSIVEVTADDASAGEPETEIWIALAKPSQALTFSLQCLKDGRPKY